MPIIDFGAGPNTDTGDTIAQALAKLEAYAQSHTASAPPSPPPPPPPPPAGGPLTTFPTSSAIIYELDPDALAGTANNARVTSLPSTAGITATAVATGPRFVQNAANGHAGLLFAENDAERLTLGRPAALAAVMEANENWSVVITFKGATSTGYNALIGDDFQSGFYLGAGSGYVNKANDKRSYAAADPAGNVHTLIYSGEAIPLPGRTFFDGTLFAVGGCHLKGGGPDILIGCLQAFGNLFPFGGTILNIRILSGALTAAEALQAHFWACTRYGKALPIAGRTFFPVLDGDSITFGIGDQADNSYPAQLAAARGWPLGTYANVGKPSGAMGPGALGGYNMYDRAARDVDGFAAVTGLPVVLVSGEWYNQGYSGGTAGDGAATAGNNRTYAAARKQAGKVAKHLMWTSTSADREGGGRDGFNASLMADHPDIDAVIPVHTNAAIGVDGQHSNRTYFDDDAHPKAAGYAVLAGLIDAALTSAGYSG